MSLQVQIRIRTNDDQFPLEYWLQRVPELADYYLTQDRLTCCSFQAGFCIDIAGKRWNGDNDSYDFDEPWMTSHWLHGLIIMFGSSTTTVGVGFWEQSTATIKRIDQDILEIEDPAAHSGGGSCAPAWVNANEFADQITEATKKYIQLCEKIEEELVRRGDTVPDEKKEKIINELYSEVFRQKLAELEEVRNSK